MTTDPTTQPVHAAVPAAEVGPVSDGDLGAHHPRVILTYFGDEVTVVEYGVDPDVGPIARVSRGEGDEPRWTFVSALLLEDEP